MATTATAERGMNATASAGGNNLTAPAADSHEPPFAFTGTIHHVVVDIADEMITDDEAGIARLKAQQ